MTGNDAASGLAFASATELAQKIRDREVSCEELLKVYLERVDRFNGELNAIVVDIREQALEDARAADAKVASGKELPPLHGVPMTVKESYNVAGTPTTWGNPGWKDNVASEDAESVKRLKDAGVVVFGKTNVPLMLADFQSYNEVYGTTLNPYDHERVPGGSSGGSAAALAAGLTGLETGSDIGGSIRNPAHFCGVYGHKPTWGIVSDEGHSLPGTYGPADIAVVGPMSRSAEDLELSMDIVAGPARRDQRGWQLNLPRPSKTSLADFRIAILPTHEHAPVATEIADRVQTIGDTLAKLGATVSDAALPDIDFDESFEIYSSLLWGVMSQGMSEEEKDAFRAKRGQPRDDSIASDVERFAVQEHGEWLSFSNQRFRLRQQWDAFFNDWDILICPQTATEAFPHDHGDYLGRTLRVDNEDQDYFRQVFWAGTITVAHLPSTVFPTGLSRGGLPIGLQAVGAEYNDYITIDFARLMAGEIGGFQAPPDFP